MATFNKDYFSEEFYSDETAHMQVAMSLSGLITNEELEKLKADWNKQGGHKAIPYWKFALENIKVSY